VDDDCDGGSDDIIEMRKFGALIDSYVYKTNGRFVGDNPWTRRRREARQGV
jgi:hypothetical protein